MEEMGPLNSEGKGTHCHVALQRLQRAGREFMEKADPQETWAKASQRTGNALGLEGLAALG